ncbi:N-methyl-L-tryptophan oxidase [Brochothrix campestris]|uniref:N-methyltryptophan oxidase n=1 Tax=Brochothrix campestris FSL F6-1037 TaxID=1265861 RepID=W7CM83_9LIST|nr:N-methyl-L-tryptophan oxidase [Brochothrix campestris]EUJ40664.1 N-methyltryptophan oxidase [Brochothrix campestris FSL F6-1037]
MHYQHIVIGAGSMGMAAGYFLANQGKEVLMLDAFNPPHEQGSHHGGTRLIRYAYGEGVEYVPFAIRASELWQTLQAETPREIFKQTGVLNVGRSDGVFVRNVCESAKTFELPLAVLTAAEVNEKWPGLTLPADLLGCFEPTSGILLVEECIAAYREAALKAGAELRLNSRVIRINPQQGNEPVTIETADGAVFTADAVIVSVGAWAGELLQQLDLKLPVTPIRKTFAWYEATNDLYDEQSFPGFAFDLGDSAYYGFPSVAGAGLKLGRHDGGLPINPDEPKQAFGTVKGDEEELTEFLRRFMPQVGALKEGKTCMYTMTPDEDFVIDLHPTYRNIAIAAGFSGHGFKFASAVGEIVSDLVTRGETTLDISPFSLDRFQ